MKKYIIILSIKTWFIITILPLVGMLFFRLMISTLKFEFYYCAQIALSYILMLIWAVYLKRKNQIEINIVHQRTHNSKGYLVTTLLAGIGFSCFFCFTYYFSFFNTAIPNGFTEEAFMQLYNSLPMMLSTAVIMPIIEEILFRGIIQELFIRYAGVKWGIFFSVTLFALFHGNGFLFCFLFTLVISCVYLRTKNIVYPIIGHVSNNLMNVILEKSGLIGYDKNMSIIICFGFCLLCLMVVSLKANTKR